MQLHVNARKMAFSGIMLALTVICIILSGVLEFNTLFLLAIAGFSVGIIVRESGLRFGAAYLVAAIFLGFILAPNKMYCITFAAMGIYVLADEALWILIRKITLKAPVNGNICLWIGKFIIFNIMYIPILLIFPELLFAGGAGKHFFAIAWIGGQAIMVIYDFAYDYFQKYIWTKYRKFLDMH